MPQQFYKPSVHVDEIGLTSDKYIPLNASVTELPLKISVGPMSTQVYPCYLKRQLNI